MALRAQTQDFLDGAVLFFHPTQNVPLEAPRRLCVVTLADDQQYLGIPKLSYKKGLWSIWRPAREMVADVNVKNASPIQWIKL
jgi:hypothetical protein